MKTQADDFVAPLCRDEIAVVDKDHHILVIEKPSGLLSLSGKNPLNIDSVHFRIKQLFPSAMMVHRLDFGTSGLMVLALNKAANAHLTKQFQNRTVTKRYVSVLDGQLDHDEGVIDFPIAKDQFPFQKICRLSGKTATSHYQVLERLSKPIRTRVMFTPMTGRTHQLRIHSREIGHPIVGCDLYGTEKTRSMADRLLLHAVGLEFDHPITGERIVVNSPCPF